jgi:hypothetical protein
MALSLKGHTFKNEWITFNSQSCEGHNRGEEVPPFGGNVRFLFPHYLNYDIVYGFFLTLWAVRSVFTRR